MTLLLSDFQEKKNDRLASTVGIPLKSEGIVEVNLNFFLKCVSSSVRFSQLVLLLNMANTENGSMSKILDPSFCFRYATSDCPSALVTLPRSSYIHSTSSVRSSLYRRRACANSSYRGTHVNLLSISIKFS